VTEKKPYRQNQLFLFLFFLPLVYQKLVKLVACVEILKNKISPKEERGREGGRRKEEGGGGRGEEGGRRKEEGGRKAQETRTKEETKGGGKKGGREGVETHLNVHVRGQNVFRTNIRSLPISRGPSPRHKKRTLLFSYLRIIDACTRLKSEWENQKKKILLPQNSKFQKLVNLLDPVHQNAKRSRKNYFNN
jgi:hypothetical protein